MGVERWELKMGWRNGEVGGDGALKAEDEIGVDEVGP